MWNIPVTADFAQGCAHLIHSLPCSLAFSWGQLEPQVRNQHIWFQNTRLSSSVQGDRLLTLLHRWNLSRRFGVVFQRGPLIHAFYPSHCLCPTSFLPFWCKFHLEAKITLGGASFYCVPWQEHSGESQPSTYVLPEPQGPSGAVEEHATFTGFTVTSSPLTPNGSWMSSTQHSDPGSTYSLTPLENHFTSSPRPSNTFLPCLPPRTSLPISLRKQKRQNFHKLPSPRLHVRPQDYDKGWSSNQAEPSLWALMAEARPIFHHPSPSSAMIFSLEWFVLISK